MRRFLTVFFLFLNAVAFGQTVSNVKSSRDGDMYAITYHLDRDASNLKIVVSFDGGKTFSQPLKEVFGDVGNVPAGNHTIYWDFKSEMGSANSASVLFKIISGTSSASSGTLKFQSSSPDSSQYAYDQFTSNSGQGNKKNLFQFEVGGGIGLDVKHFCKAHPLYSSIGILHMGSNLSHYLGTSFECDTYKEGIIAPMFEYRFGRRDLKGFWGGFNVGINFWNYDYVYESYYTYYDTYNSTAITAHFLAGYRITKWLDFRLEAGWPNIGCAIVLNLPNMF